MTGARLWLLGFAAVLLLGLEGSYLFLHGRAVAQSPVAGIVASDANGQAHALASQFVDQRHLDQVFLTGLLGPGRVVWTGYLRKSGMTEQGAEQAFDQYFGPAFKARLPEFRTQVEDVLTQEFTIDELQSMVANRQDDALRSASSKMGKFQESLTPVGLRWGFQTMTGVIRKNIDVFAAMGFKPKLKQE